MNIKLPKHFDKIKITKTDWFIAKSTKENEKIKIQLPKPNIKWYIDGYYHFNDKNIEVTLIDSIKER